MSSEFGGGGTNDLKFSNNKKIVTDQRITMQSPLDLIETDMPKMFFIAYYGLPNFNIEIYHHSLVI